MNKANKLYLQRLRKGTFIDRRPFDQKLEMLHETSPIGYALIKALMMIDSTFKKGILNSKIR